MTPVLQVHADDPRIEPWLFVSHAAADKKRLVEPFVRRLQERGIRVWIDQDRIGPGDSMVGRVFTEGIGLAGAGMVVLSEHSAGSKWMQQELAVLYSRKITDGIPIVVLRMDDAPIPPMLADEYLVTVDPAADWSAELERVAGALTAGPGLTAPRPAAPVGRLRRKLEHPGGWIEADSAITAATDAAVPGLRQARPPAGTDLPHRVHGLLGRYDDITGPLVEVLAQCGYVGDPAQPRLWKRPLQRVLRTALPGPGRPGEKVWERAAWYPALRLTYAFGVAAVAGGREGLLHPLLDQQVPAPGEPRPVWRVLSPDQVIDPGLAQLLPGWTGRGRTLSIHLRTTLRPALAGFLTEVEYAEAFERYEYLRSLLELHHTDGAASSLGEFGWEVRHARSPVAAGIAEEVRALGDSWPLLRAGAFGGSVAAVLRAQAELLRHLRRRFP